jgi:hypothetical protein
MRTVMFAVAFVAMLAIPATAHAASPTAQFIRISVSAPILGVSGSCADLSTYQVNIGQPVAATVSGVVNDTGTFTFLNGFAPRFPHQIALQAGISGAHTQIVVTFTGSVHCLDDVNAYANGLVWTGVLTDVATGRTWQLSGAGRGNAIHADVAGGVFSIDFQGLARP